jgi:hypothetical protein
MRRTLANAVFLLSLVAGCGSGASPTTSSVPIASIPNATPAATGAPPSSASDVLQYVAFGDSWPEGDHCNGCLTFVSLWVDGLKSLTGRDVELTDMTGQAERSSAAGKTSDSLLEAVRNDATTREVIAAAEVILISTGGNEVPGIIDAIKAGTCGGTDGEDCVRAQGEHWRANYEAILSEIDGLRAGKPTVLRFVNDENPFISFPEFNEGLPEGFALETAARIYQQLYDEMCRAARAHGGECIDVRPIINGPTMDQPGDENSPESMRAITDALIASGVPELEGAAP